MNKVYFKTKFYAEDDNIYRWDSETETVHWVRQGVDEWRKYPKSIFDFYVKSGNWFLCNKDGSPIKTKNSVKRPNENWKKTINKDKYLRCIRDCVNLGNYQYYNPKTNCFYVEGWCDDSEAYFKYNLSKLPDSKWKFREDVLTIYNEYLEEEMKQTALQRDHFNENEYSKEGDRELFSELKESLEECVNIKKERENDEYTGGSVNYYKLRVNNPTTATEPYEAECNDIIEALDMNYAEGNAFKAIWRKCAARKFGVQKKGYDNGLYDSEKVVFFGERMVVQSRGEG